MFWASLLSYPLYSQNTPDLGIAGDYGILSGQSISANQPIHVLGKAGANSSINELIESESAIDANGAGDVVPALANLDSVITVIDSLDGIIIPEDLNGQTLTSGVHNISGNAIIHGGSLRFVGTSSSIYIINISGTLIIDENAIIEIVDGVSPKNIFWNVHGDVTIKGAHFFGNLLASHEINLLNSVRGYASFLAKGNIKANMLPNKFPSSFLFANNYSFAGNGSSSMPSANCNWANHISNNGFSEGRAVAYDSHGNVYISGVYNGVINFGNCASCTLSAVSGSQWQMNGFLAKYSPSGTCLWVQNILCSYTAEVNDLTIDDSDNIYIAGYWQNVAWWGYTVKFFDTPGSLSSYTPPVNNLGYFMFVAKYDTSGNRLWVSNTGDNAGTVNKDQIAFGIKAIGTGSATKLYLTGHSDKQITFYSQSIAPVTLLSTTNNASSFIAIYGTNGNYQNSVFTEGLTTTSYSNANAIGVDASGKCYITGWIRNSIKFSSTTNLISFSGTDDVFIAGYSSSLSFLWANKAYTTSGSNSTDVGNDIAIRNTNAYIVGTIYGNSDFGGCGSCAPSPGASGPYRNIFVAQYSLSGNPNWVSTATSGGNNFLSALGITTAPTECNINICGKQKTSNFGTCLSCVPSIPGLYIANYSSAGICQEVSPYLCTNVNSELTDIAVTSCNKTIGTGWMYGTVTIGTIPSITGPAIRNPYVFQFMRSPIVSQSSCYNVTTCSSCSAYQWFSGVYPSGSPITGATSLNYSPINLSGNYYLTVTDVSGCTASTQVSLTSGPVISVAASPTTIACGQTSTLTASGGQNYTWSPALGLNTTTGSTVIANPGYTTAYSVASTNAIGCSTSSSVTVNVNTNCCSGAPNSSNVPTSTFTASQLLNSDYASQWPAVIGGDYDCVNGTIIFAIDGVFHVDKSIMFTKIIIRMGPYAQIKIEKGATLTFDAVKVEACNGVMWDKIWLSEPSAKFISTSFSASCPTIIRDGITAVVSDFGAYYQINRTLFDNNYKGIVVNQFSGNHTGIVYDTRFESSAGLLPPYNSFTKSYIGIELNDVNHIAIGIPFSSTPNNKFDNMYFGIHSVRSNVIIKNNKFSNFSNYSFGSYCYLQNCCLAGTCSDNLGCQCISSGVAIYDHGNPAVLIPTVGLTVGGVLSPYESNSFSNCYAGVLSQNNSQRNIYILKNSFTQINKGILIRNSHNGFIQIVKNTLDNFYAGTNHPSYGISISYANQGQIDINNNQINMISPAWANYGISVQSSNYVAPPPYGNVTRSICSNTIRQSYNGIYLSTTRTLMINKNNIIFPAGNLGTRVGIKASSSPVNISYNTIFHPNSNPAASDTSKLIGIYGINTPGLYVAGHNPASNGIIMNTGTGIKMQNICTNSRLILNKMSSCYNGVRLFNAKIGTQGYASGTTTYEFSNVWTSNISPNLVSGGISAFTKWYKIGALPNNVQPASWFPPSPTPNNYPYTLPNDCPVFNFTNNAQIGVGGGGNIPSPLSIEERDNYFGEIVKGTAEYLNNEEEFAYFDKEHAYRSIIDDPTLLNMGNEHDSIYQDFKSRCDNSALGVLERAWSFISNEDYENARTTLNGVAPSNLVESNRLSVYNIYLQYVPYEFFNFTTDDYSTLEKIAFQDPATGGEGVFLARTMLGIDPDMEEEPEARIASKPRNDNLQSPTPETFIGKIYPNPSGGDLFLDYSIPNGCQASIIIFDLLGREVFRANLMDEKRTITIRSTIIEEGLFIYKVEVDGKETVRDRFVKITNRN